MDREKILNEIENLQGRIGQTDYANEEYKLYQAELMTWQELLDKLDEAERKDRSEEAAKRKDRSVKRLDIVKAGLDFGKTSVAVLGTLTGICLIVYAENDKILTSKAMSFVTKMLPKVV